MQISGAVAQGYLLKEYLLSATTEFCFRLMWRIMQIEEMRPPSTTLEVTWLTIMGSLTEFNYNNWISVDWNSLSPVQFAQLFPNVHRYTC